MKNPIRLIAGGALAASLALGGIVAANAAAPYVFTGSPYIPIPNGVEQYQKQVPLTGFSLAFTKGQSEMQLSPAGTLATGTITLANPAYDGQVNCFVSSQIQTALTLQVASGSGQTVNNAITAMPTAFTRFCYLYSASNKTWDRIQ